jgi:hypothetical protein
MNGKDQEFDTVVLGFDEKSKETVEALQEQGKRVLYIPIDPQTMITMMSQKQVHSTATDETITHLQVQQHQMQTTFQNTTTYLIQPLVQHIKPDEIQERLEENIVEELEETLELNLHSTTEEENDSSIVLSDELETQEVAFTFTEVDEVIKPHHSDQENADSDDAVQVESPTKEIDEKLEKEIEEVKETMENDEIEEVEETVENDESEEIEQDFTFPMITPLTKESSLIDNRMLGIRGSKHRGLQRNNKNGLSGSILSSYHLFNPIRIEGEEENFLHDSIQQTEQTDDEKLEEQLTERIEEVEEEETKQHTVQTPDFINDKNNFIFHGPPSPETFESELDESRNEQEQEESFTMPNLSRQETVSVEEKHLESTLEQNSESPKMDDLVLQSHLEDTTFDEDEHVPEEEIVESANAEHDQEQNSDGDLGHTTETNETPEQVEKLDSPTLVLDRDIRLRKKFSFHQLHQDPKVAPTIEPAKREKTTTNQVEEQTKKPDVFPLEPFSSRRRNKKSRLFSSLEATIPNPIIQPSNTNKTDQSFSSLIQESIIHHDLEKTPINPTQNESLEEIEDIQEEEQDHIETNSDNLKIDNIEFEEPYGYNSFEDFFPSFSNSNDRKRQEMDKIEKRKIALRGLHNLINNLG